MLINTKLLHQTKSTNPISVRLPNGTAIKSTHQGLLPLTMLPQAARQAHILPGLASHSLISIAQLCDNGCTALFDKQQCHIMHNGITILKGPRCPKTKLWLLPTSNQKHQVNLTVTTEGEQHHKPVTTEGDAQLVCNNAYQQKTTKELLRYLHAAAFSPTAETWKKAISNNQFSTWPRLTTKRVQTLLPDSMATAKGHLKRKRKNLQSTKPKNNDKSTNITNDLFPNKQERTGAAFVAFFQADPTKNTAYTDLTGRFPVTSTTGAKYIFLLYHYDTNSILAETMNNKSDEEALRVYTKLYDFLAARGYPITLNIMDNEASLAVKQQIIKTGATYQLVEPHNHKVNAAERAIQTFKHHFIAGLCSTDPKFPITLWDMLVPQAVLTLNLLRTSRINPKLSAYAQLNGQFDFMRTPLAPPGTQVLLFEDPTTRKSWAPHGKSAWYVGPAMEHYRCYKFYVPETNRLRTAATAKFFPAHCKVPQITTTDAAIEAANDLIKALTKPSPALPNLHLETNHYNSLKKLAALFNNTTKQQQENTRLHHPTIQSTIKNNTDKPIPQNTTIPEKVHSPPTNIIDFKPQEIDYTSSSDPFQTIIRGPTHRYPTRKTQPSTKPTIIPTIPEKPPDPLRRSSRLLTPRTYSNLALHALTLRAACRPFPDESAYLVLDNDSGLAQSYKQLIKNPKTKEVWSKAMCIELGRLLQGYETTKGTNTCVVLTPEQIKAIPKDRVVTYARIVVDYRTMKADPNRVRITVGGNLINYPGNVTTKTADMITSKLLWNSVLSTPNARYACFDIKNMYLQTPMQRREYMRIPILLIPDEFIKLYALTNKVVRGHIYLEIQKGMYGLPQAGKLANDLLRKRLKNHGYFETTTPGLWTHTWRPIHFTLVVDDFGIKFVAPEHATHLKTSLENYYEIEADWSGSRYIGISLDWNYNNKTLDIDMPNFTNNKLRQYGHTKPKRPQDAPYPAANPYSRSQAPLPLDDTPMLNEKRKKRIEQIIGSFLYYGRAIDITLLKALNSLATQQSTPTENTDKLVKQFLDYCAWHPDAKIRFFASDMLLQVHSDASYLNEQQARSTAGGHFFLGKKVHHNEPIFLNGAVHTVCSILKHVAASAAEAELGALFLNTQELIRLRLALKNMGHPQPPTPIHCDNKCAVGIINDSIKQQRSRSMNMRYFWTRDQFNNGIIVVHWYPGTENLGDYVTKHHPPAHHRRVRKFYIYTDKTPKFLHRAIEPRLLRGCVKPLHNTERIKDIRTTRTDVHG